MIKKIETIDDVKMIYSFAPELAEMPLHNEGFGLLDEGEDGLGTFFDEETKDVFKAWIVRGSNDDISFFMKQSLNTYDDKHHNFLKTDVWDWCYGQDITKAEAIDYIFCRINNK